MNIALNSLTKHYKYSFIYNNGGEGGFVLSSFYLLKYNINLRVSPFIDGIRKATEM
jgi:hypothetical protein